MKKLYLVRHAKSSWKNPELSDKERPLNKRGKNDAPFMGKTLKEKKVKPDLMISSDAVRAKKTAYAIAKELEYEKNNIVLTDDIYEASSLELLNLVKSFDQDFSSVMMFGHNPAFTMLNNQLSDNYIDNIPTCGITAIKFGSEWKDVADGGGKSEFFIFPKLYA